MTEYAIQYAASLHPDEEAFHRRMSASPDDSIPPLIYADWLEEHDQPAHAAFIRHAHSDDGDGYESSGYLNPGYANPHADRSVVFMMPRTPIRSYTPVDLPHVMLGIKDQSTSPDAERWHKWHVIYPTAAEAQEAAKGLIAEGARASIGTSHLRTANPEPNRNDS